MVSSLLISFAPATVRVYATTTKRTSGSAKEEDKSPLDFVLGFMTKQDQFYETDPILKKVEEKSGTTSGGRGSVRGGRNSPPTPVPPKKNDGGFAGLGGFFKK